MANDSRFTSGFKNGTGADSVGGGAGGSVLYEYKTADIRPLEPVQEVEEIKEEKPPVAPIAPEAAVAEYAEQQRQDPILIEDGGRRKRVTVKRRKKSKAVGFEHNVCKDPNQEDKIEKGLRSFVVGLFDGLFSIFGWGTPEKESEKAPKPSAKEPEREQER